MRPSKLVLGLIIAGFTTTVTLTSCAPKTTSQGEILLEKIQEVESRTKVGINYIDYTVAAQEIQIELDKFQKDPASQKLKYAGNLIATA